MEKKNQQISILREISKKSKLNSRDAKIISNKINKAMAKKFKEMK